ncbi:MAG TPA: hypothetical protein DCZ63_11515 [Geobacter sp.]|nr:hypothetical protein [Geobacter sp.]
MRTLTRPESAVLACVPESTRAAFMRSGTVKQGAADRHKYHPATVEAVWLRLIASGLIEETVGFCRRTADGDMALEPQGINV